MTTHIHSYFAHGYFGGVWPFWYQEEAPPSEVYGSLVATETTDVPVSAGLVFWTAVLDALEPSDVARFIEVAANLGQLAAVEGADVAAIAALVGRIGRLAAIEVTDQAALRGLLNVVGAIEATDPRDTALLVGAVPVWAYEIIHLLEGRADSVTSIEGRGGRRRVMH